MDKEVEEALGRVAVEAHRRIKDVASDVQFLAAIIEQVEDSVNQDHVAMHELEIRLAAVERKFDGLVGFRDEDARVVDALADRVSALEARQQDEAGELVVDPRAALSRDGIRREMAREMVTMLRWKQHHLPNELRGEAITRKDLIHWITRSYLADAEEGS